MSRSEVDEQEGTVRRDQSCFDLSGSARAVLERHLASYEELKASAGARLESLYDAFIAPPAEQMRGDTET